MHPRFFTFAVVALLVIGLLVFGGSAMQRNAWTQGYLMGQAAANGDGNATAALAPYMAHGPGFGGPSFGALACLLPLSLLAFLFFAVGGFFRHKAWHSAGGPPDQWRQHWQRGPGPWRQQGGKPGGSTGPSNPAEPAAPATGPESVAPNR